MYSLRRPPTRGPQPVPTEPEDGEGDSDEEKEDLRFTVYSPPTHMHNVDLSTNDALEFPDLPHRMRGHTSSSLDSGVSQDHPKMDSDMIASLILLMVKVDPKTSMSILIANICNQLRYTSSYRKAWIAKQKALEKIHSRWDASYNEETYFRLAALFPKRAASYKGQIQGGHVWCRKVLQEINKAKARANTMHTVCHDRDNLWFRVTEFDRLNQGITGG
ncbi:hypothetical protein J1N35_018709 [Gossypium stocksii]|uniref:Uncharacterized protein n=1 Tax=Gossypium stocksii TaxID=47602 RepID=A0A9D3VQU9_9ROSI|nr:hypothetical protein J1N35_018709 [Gossypium stocksii]